MLLNVKQKERHGQAFLLGLFMAGLLFGTYALIDNGYFLYYGDFNVQQIPFYQLAHNAVSTGNIGWNWNTDLGANFVGSYSFYMLGSPFFWLTLLFPNSFVPYLMGPLLALKFACASLTAYCYLRRYTRYTHNALIGAVLYAFSGFSVYNVFFNHFHEAIVFFPLLLLAFDQLITENRRGFFAFMVCICAMSNYFFFCGMVVFVIIYFVIKLLTGSFKITLARFGWLAFEAVLGVAMAAVILLPTFLAISSMNRVNGYLVGWNAIIYSEPQVFYNILQSMFFPPDNPARLVFFPSNDYQWSSMSAWLPLFGMTGVIAWLQSKKRTWQKRLLTTCLIMALVPFLNSAFYMFNYSYYARWYFMPILIMCLVTVQALEDPEIEWAPALRWSIGITVAITLVVGLLPSLHTIEDGFSQFGIYKDAQVEGSFYTLRFWLECFIAIISLVILLMLMLYRTGVSKRSESTSLGERIHTVNKQSPNFWRATLCSLCAVCLIYSALHIGWGKTHSDSTDFLIGNMLEGEIDLDINDGERIDVYDGMDNTAMYMGYPSIQAFHSIVPVSVFEFYDFVGIDRGVATRPDTTHYAIRGLLSVRYLIDYTGGKNFVAEGTVSDTMQGYKLIDFQNDHNIYLNEHFIPYGFTYENCISRSDAELNYKSNEAALMLKAIVLEDKDIAKHTDLLNRITDTSLYQSSEFGQAGYLKDCDTLRATSEGNTLQIDKKGFTSAVNLEKENLVFYSVPYDDGWSVTVDGKDAEIIRANVGFMAVRVPEGAHTVRFDYKTPGLTVGLIVSLSGLVALAAYLFLFRRYKAKHPECMAVCNPERESLEAQWTEYDLAEMAFAGELADAVDLPKPVIEEPENDESDVEEPENDEAIDEAVEETDDQNEGEKIDE